MKNILHIGFCIFLCLSAGYTSAMLTMMFAPAIGFDGPIWAAIIGCLVFVFAMIFLDRLEPRPPFFVRAGTPEAEDLEARTRQTTVALAPDHPIVKQWEAEHGALPRKADRDQRA
jgi:hypothetical protein